MGTWDRVLLASYNLHIHGLYYSTAAGWEPGIESFLLLIIYTFMVYIILLLQGEGPGVLLASYNLHIHGLYYSTAAG